MSVQHPRIKSFNMTGIDAVLELTDGNPGAIRVMSDLVHMSRIIDPQSALGSWGPLILTDSMDVYGNRIWDLYKYVCDENYYRTLGIMRAFQLGHLSQRDLDRAIDTKDSKVFDVDAMLALVKEQLQEFQIEAPAEGANVP